MNEHGSTEADRDEAERKLEAAVQRAVRAAVLASAYAGQPACGERDGKVVWLTPDEIFAELGAMPLAKPNEDDARSPSARG